MNQTDSSVKVIDQKREKIIEKLQVSLKKHPEIQLAYLYGSWAKGTQIQSSDIDIGVLVDKNALNDPWYSVKLKNSLESENSFNYPIDVRVLNKTSPKFCYQVIFHNPRLVVKNEKIRIEFETTILLQWYDMRSTWENFYKVQREVLKI